MEVDQAQLDYFVSYEDLETHRLMLEDDPRTEAYKDAIFKNKNYFKDKVVMDVGCGTGILSIFCAQAGAKKVYAVEASKLAQLAKDIVIENQLENIIEVIHKKVEDVVLPENTKVDAIVSEWMGFYLLHEGMLDSVLFARDNFLKKDGQLFPHTAVLYVAPCSIPSLYDKWANIQGVSMKTFAKSLRSQKYNKPEIMCVQPEDLLAEPEIISWINLTDDKVSNLNSFTLQHVTGACKSGAYQGLCLWFDCMFPDLCGEIPKLGTGPKSPPTHWKQTVVVLPQEQDVDIDEPIAFKIDLDRNKENRRRYDLQVTMLDPEAVKHPVPCSCHMTKCILIKTFLLQNGRGYTNILEEDDISDEDG